ncbi:unnamed protein product [Lactuca saligna]|uniref:TIR domain-containing protein n=1 Tax=Lactuca saligna TaxID=75948 RepID=A0AA35ZQK4_LACSI|nr:unnamed protein product [Lactuca saligna]
MASSSSSSPPAPAFSSQSLKYNVFLSFRGEDTRKTFVDHLYTALEQQGIYTYKDDETLHRGELIGPSLMKAIEESQIAVIIFSENYADSSWCLDELACIMKCKDTKGHIVMPIFYGVDPSEVRKQKQKYGEALAKHELENKRKVESWRKALVDASNISGWEPKHIANGHESKVIKEIVETISQSLQPVTSSANENLIGIAARIQRLKLELQTGSGDVRMIGIWGVGGGGKTTLASSIYDEICRQFDGCCFVENIREESGRYGLEKLQEKILCGVLKQKEVQGIGRVEEGRQMIKDRLCHKMVLIVLDDVNQLDQLKALAGSHDWFGEGSRIIITTRDEHLLTAHKVDVIHNIILLNNDEAMKLFHKLSLQDYSPKEDYERLSKDVVSYAGGLPLALAVLGPFLCDKDTGEWMSALARLKEIPNDDIVGKLKISFDGLTEVEKDLFLDIACFFRRERKDRVMEILDACGLYPIIGVKVLIQKALITISNGRFDMHDLVQEMGHHIVRGEHPNNPEKHSRIWKEEDVLKISAMDATMELKNIKALQIGLNWLPKKEQDLPLIAANMKNLRYIKWDVNHENPLLNNFPPRELRYLHLSRVLQKQLWEGCKLLPNLKIMELWSSNIIMTPDFDGLPNLERLKLYQCMYLEKIHPSIGRLERLVLLSVEACTSLKMFPPVTRLKKLETLSFHHCPQLFKPSEIQQQNMDNLGRSNLPGLECCFQGLSLCQNKIGLQFILNMQELGFLTKLELSNCGLGDEDIGSDVWELANLQVLNLDGNKFSRLNFGLFGLPRLKWLNLSWCQELVEVSELPPSISILTMDYCYSLRSFGDISNCKWLWKVSHAGGYNVNPLDGEILLHSMLQAIDIEHHFVDFALAHQIPKGFVGRCFMGKTFTWRFPTEYRKPSGASIKSHSDKFTLHLPNDWYNEFCGLLIRVVANSGILDIDIIIKQEPDNREYVFKNWRFDKQPEPEYDGKVKTYVGYVPFSSLRRITSLNSSYNIISFHIHKMYWTSFTAELVPRRSKDDLLQITQVATNCSEFWNNGQTFEIQQDLGSSIKISWGRWKNI